MRNILTPANKNIFYEKAFNDYDYFNVERMAIYNNTQLNNRNDCIKVPSSLYDACVEETQKPYEEYEKEYEGL